MQFDGMLFLRNWIFNLPYVIQQHSVVSLVMLLIYKYAKIIFFL